MNSIRFLSGMVGTVGVLAKRTYRKATALPYIDISDPVRKTVSMIHPPELKLVITEIFEHSSDARTFRLAAEGSGTVLPLFRAGQYLSIKETIERLYISRPYSISSAPYEASGNGGGFYEITVRMLSDGFFSPFIFDAWKKGTRVSATGPHGEFYHEPIRDTGDIVAIAGGSGITPFFSMARQIARGGMDARLTILYGIRNMREALFMENLISLANQVPDRISVCYVVSEPDGTEQCATGFIDAALIRSEVGELSGKTFFVCGPPALHNFFKDQATLLAISPRRVRSEVSAGNRMIITHPAFPGEAKGKTFQLTVHKGWEEHVIPARADESILMALERGGIAAESRCRSGSCGACRCELTAGNIFIEPETDARRRADREYGFIHSCSTYPTGDCMIQI
ncbi:MAG: flavin reductase family protein [Syntrophales bacterium]|jgi:ferredoxin-NADP reductase